MSCISENRDLKPTNVLLDENDRPLLMDLGSMNKARIDVRGSREAMTVQVRSENRSFIKELSTNQNIKWIIFLHFLYQDWAAQRCTISYRAPELFNVESHCIIDERTDIWVILFFCGCFYRCNSFPFSALLSQNNMHYRILQQSKPTHAMLFYCCSVCSVLSAQG